MTNKNYYLISISVLIAALTAFYAFYGRDIAATHPTLAASSLPPTIPVREFYADTASEWAYKPSFDGSLIAWYGVRLTKNVIRVRRTGEDVPFLTIPAENVGNFIWHPYKNRLLFFSKGRLWRVDPENAERDQWIDITPRGLNHWTFPVFPRSEDERIVIASRDRNPALLDLYTVRQDGGGKELLVRNESETLNWWVNRANEPVLRMDRLGDGASRLLAKMEGDDEAWRTVLEVDKRDDFTTPFVYAPKAGEPLYALSNRGRDKLALVTVDLESGEEAVVAEHESVDVASVTALSPYRSAPDYVTFDDGYPERRPLTRKGRTFLNLVEDGDSPVDFNILGRSPDGRFITVARSRREKSWEYFLYDLDEGTASKLGEYAFRRNKDALVQTRPVSFKARDGLEIPAFLTLPRGTGGNNLPAVIRVHGGPALRTAWGYDDEVQFLANRGYAVLSVNFRGSVGYGKAFRAAGYGAFGEAMQDDIADAARWLASEGIADADNMAVMGGSYGGYSAALAMTRDPGLFKAAIVEYAVLDVPYQMRNNPFAWGLSPDETQRYFGDPENEADLETMRMRSPQTHVENVRGAILLTAGKRDRIVGFEQTEEFERALKAAGKDVEAVYYEDEGHGYSRWQTEVKRARLIEDFLAERLGGRSGGFDIAEWAAAYLD